MPLCRGIGLPSAGKAGKTRCMGGAPGTYDVRLHRSRRELRSLKCERRSNADRRILSGSINRNLWAESVVLRICRRGGPCVLPKGTNTAKQGEFTAKLTFFRGRTQGPPLRIILCFSITTIIQTTIYRTASQHIFSPFFLKYLEKSHSL